MRDNTEKRRTPDVQQRRRDLCDAAIQLLADHGAKGLSHPRVDRQAGVADGSTSYYFRTRKALVHAVAERVAELDLADLERAALAQPDVPGRTTAADLAAVVMKSITGTGLTRTRARFELLLQAGRDPALSEVFERNTRMYVQLHRDLAHRPQPESEIDPDRIADDALVTMNFISGLMISAAAGAQPMLSPDHLEQILSRIAGAIGSAGVERNR